MRKQDDMGSHHTLERQQHRAPIAPLNTGDPPHVLEINRQSSITCSATQNAFRSQKGRKHMDLGITAGLVLLSGVAVWVKKGVEAFFKGYGKKTGEIEAIQDQLGKILRQQERQTEAVKTIEARISGELWSEQERWKLKRDIYMSLIEYWSHIAEMLEDALRVSEPNWPRYSEQKRELERQAESRRARALSHIVFSEPVLAQVRRVEATIDRFSLDKQLWERSADKQGFLLGLIHLVIQGDIEAFAAVAADDLKAFGADAQAVFLQRQSERQRQLELLDRLKGKEELTAEDESWLRARLLGEPDLA
jgi:hypothetical protein